MEPVRDSVFISALRAFCKTIAVIFGICIAFIPLFILMFSLGGDTDLSPTTTLTYIPDADGVKKLQPATSPVILRIDIDGVIGEGNYVTSVVENQLQESRTGTLKEGRVKAILLHLNTPGGTVTDSDGIYRQLLAYKEKYKTPIYAYVDGLCASGGMYITSACDRVYSSPSSIIGSVGVFIGPFFNFKEAMNKFGINSELLTQGKNKDMMNPFRTWKPGEDDSLKAICSYYYDRFVDIVTTSRPRIDKEKLLNDYGANVFDPKKAESIGFIDESDSNYIAVMKDLMKAAGIDESKPYQVVKLDPKKNWLSCLSSAGSHFGALEEFITAFFSLGSKKDKTISEQFSYRYEPGMERMTIN